PCRRRSAMGVFAREDNCRLLQVSQQNWHRRSCRSAARLQPKVSRRRERSCSLRSNLSGNAGHAALLGRDRVSGKVNLAASVAARLLNRARETGDDYQTLLTSYCLERFLYRLAVSDRRERFVLKGAMLLRLWSDRPYRATLDLDLLRRGDGASDAIREDLRAIVATTVPPDAVDFDVERVRI